MNGHSRLPDYLGSLVLRHRLYEPVRCGLFLIAILGARALIDALILAFFGISEDGMFPDVGDRYADLIKVALSYRALVSDIVHSGAYHDWPALFQTYLLNNHYNNDLTNLVDSRAVFVSTFHIAPFATVLYLGTARLIALIGPVWVVATFILGYMAASVWLARQMTRAVKGTPRLFVFAAGTLCFSYPVLFMLTRSNLAGLVVLLDFFYLLTLRTGRWRVAGWLALACAINLRPEPAMLVLMEIFGEGKPLHRFMRMAVVGVAALALTVISFWFARAINPDYTMDHMVQGLALYKRLYAQGHMGDGWNVSAHMFVKYLANGPSLPPIVPDILAKILLAVAALILLYGLRLAAAGRIGWNQWLFVLCALPAIIMPVHAYYHMVRFIPVMVWLVHDLTIEKPRDGDIRLALLAITALAISPLSESETHGLLVVILLFMGGDVALFPAPRTRSAG